MTADGQFPVGFVGLGVMGGRMAQRLLCAGHPVVAYDPDVEAAAAAREAGATVAASPREVADAAAVVMVSLPSPEIVREVALGDDGLAKGSAIEVYVDLSTTGVATAQAVSDGLAAHDIAAVDAPVSGGPAGAEAGRLTSMVSGPSDPVERVRPLVEAFAGNVFVVGAEAGQGQAAKVINNLMSACSIAITAEAMVLGVRAGLDPAMLLDVIHVSSGANNAASDKFPKQVLTRAFAHGFRLDLMAKDVHLALDEARRLEVPMVLGSTVEELWRVADATGDDGRDCTEIVRMFEAWGGAEIAAGG
ncbi:MAG TPA: NAD(P)-dependent oxidoreductase [Solirubrobacteraceae bacterium]|nr:NAD(P)-dependent oxidoreductase [Solirubrobacteraceae bacterium]